jgi:peptidoglycan/LPS O-acetylase OafA/YrhL
MSAVTIEPLRSTGGTGSVADASARTKTGHIPSLDGIRALSFLLVFVSHTSSSPTTPGGFGVTVFFFLSGFLITTLMRTEYARTGRVNLAHFWIRRALRILPPFYLVLVAATVWSAVTYPMGSLSLPATWARALHFTNYWTIVNGHSGEPAGTAVYWSLAVEEHFYLLFPWLFILLQRSRLSPRAQALVLLGLCGLVLAWRFFLVLGLHVSEERIYLGTDTRIDSILFGCALALWRNPVLDPPWVSEWRLKYLILPAALIALLVSLGLPGMVYRNTVRYSIQGFTLAFVFTAAVRLHRWPPLRALNWRPLALMGMLSYSLYLMHHTVIIAMQRALPTADGWIRGIVSMMLSIVLAYLLYVVIERPCAILRRRLTD